MRAVLIAVVAALTAAVHSRAALCIEVLALRHQLAVYRRRPLRPRLRPADRLRWAWLARRWSQWRAALVMVQPRTVIAWRRHARQAARRLRLRGVGVFGTHRLYFCAVARALRRRASATAGASSLAATRMRGWKRRRVKLSVRSNSMSLRYFGISSSPTAAMHPLPPGQ